VRQISAKVGLIASSTPTDKPALSWSPIWITTAHPVYHELTITWTVDGQAQPNSKNLPYFEPWKLPAGGHTVAVTVVDPTDFVRDPEIRATVLTATRTWNVVDGQRGDGNGLVFPASMGRGTQTTRAVGGTDVVYIDAGIPSATQPLMRATWRLDNVVIAEAENRLSFPLAPRRLSPGTHTLTVAVPRVSRVGEPPQFDTRRWTIDNTMPTVAYTLSKPVATIPAAAGAEFQAFMRDEFTMKLDPKDDQPGYVVAEFRVDGDGWHHYYGWPDAPPGTPFKFTARGTNIKELIYGSLSSEGLSPQPWEPREPGWGAHRIEYRAKDAAGNIGAVSAFRVTVMPAAACTTTISGTHTGSLKLDSGVTCLDGATVTGDVAVTNGASLVATRANISGSVTTTGAATIELVSSSVAGKLTVTGTTDRVTLFGTTAGQDAIISDSKTAKAPLVIGSVFRGALACTGNSTPPSDGGSKNAMARGATGQCRGF